MHNNNNSGRCGNAIVEDNYRKSLPFFTSTYPTVPEPFAPTTDMDYYTTAYIMSPFAMAYIDTLGRFISVNNSFCQLFGYNQEEIIFNKKYYEIVEMSERDRNIQLFDQLFTGKLSQLQIVTKLTHKHGHTLLMLITVNTIFSNYPSPKYFNIQFQDMLSLSNYADTFKMPQINGDWNRFYNASTANIIIDTHGCVIRANSKFQEYVGFTEQELIKYQFNHVVHPNDSQLVASVLHQFSLNLLRSYDFSVKFLHKNRQTVSCILSLSVATTDELKVNSKEDQPVYLIGQVKKLEALMQYLRRSEINDTNKDLKYATNSNPFV